MSSKSGSPRAPEEFVKLPERTSALISSSSRSNSSGWVAPPRNTRIRTVPLANAVGKLHVQERGRQDRSVLDRRDETGAPKPSSGCAT